MQTQTCKFDYTFLACYQGTEKHHIYLSALTRDGSAHNYSESLKLFFLCAKQVQGNHLSLVHILWRKKVKLQRNYFLLTISATFKQKDSMQDVWL